MLKFFGNLVKYLLWVAFAALLGAFVFGLFGFEGNFGEYVRYLNSVGIDGVIQFESKSKVKKSEFDDGEILDDSMELSLDEDLNSTDDILDDDYFNPSVADFGFSDLEENLGNDNFVDNISNDQSLIDLIKSREK